MPFDQSSISSWRNPTLFHASYQVAQELTAVTEGVATGGTATTIVDTRILTQADDFFNQGMAWIVRDSAEGGAAPEAEFGEVTDFALSSNTATIGSIQAGSGDPFTTAVASGDRYAISTSKYPPHQIISAVNWALREIGPIVFTDTTTLDTASSQTEFALPLASSNNLREVWIQGRTNDANDNRWFKVQNWSIERRPETTDLLILPFQYVSGRGIKLVYMQYHNHLDDPSDVIEEQIDINRLVIEASIKLLEWRDSQPGNDPNIARQLSRMTEVRGGDGLTRLERVRAESSVHQVYAPPRQSKLLILGRRVPVDQFRINP